MIRENAQGKVGSWIALVSILGVTVLADGERLSGISRQSRQSKRK